MADHTLISWTDHTWNPWVGCSKVSPGCAHCYMFEGQSRYGQNPAQVRRTSAALWRQPHRWQAAAARGSRVRVFTCSWSDWFIAEADAWRADAWAIVRACPRLDFQILTKRPERIAEHLPADWAAGYPNVWLGVSIENNRHVFRAELLRQVPARVRFISAEPLLGPLPSLELAGLDWLIIGGESGPRFRPMDLAWARDLRDRAGTAGVPVFFKQSAALRTERGIELDGCLVREFPRLESAAIDVDPSVQPSLFGVEP